jgi:hypothetical protein
MLLDSQICAPDGLSIPQKWSFSNHTLLGRTSTGKRRSIIQKPCEMMPGLAPNVRALAGEGSHPKMETGLTMSA